MSLINQMLQDLEQRKADAGSSLVVVTAQIQAVPMRRKKARLPAMLGFGLCGALAWYGLTHINLKQILSAQFMQSASSNIVAEANANQYMPVFPQQAGSMQPRLPRELESKPELERNLSLSLANGWLGQPVPDQQGVKTQPEINTQSSEKTQPSVQLAMAETTTMRPHGVQTEPKISGLVDSKTDNSSAIEPEQERVAQSVVQPAQQSLVSADKPRFAGKATFVKQASPEQQSLNDYRQALSSIQLGRVSEAQDLLRQSLVANPGNHEVRQTLVGLLVENKHRDEAMTILKAGLAMAPEQIGFVQALARLQLDSGLRNEALNSLEKGLSHAGNDSQYHGFLAALLQRAERHREAIEHYKIALNEGSGESSWLIGLGVSLQVEGRVQEAQEAYARARTASLSLELAQFVDQRMKQVQQQIH